MTEQIVSFARASCTAGGNQITSQTDAFVYGGCHQVTAGVRLRRIVDVPGESESLGVLTRS